MEINSNKVFIYPSGYRQYNKEGIESPINVNPESRLNTEFNIVNSINSLVPTINQGENKHKDSGSFIVDYSNNVLEFYVHGYWFKIIDFTKPNTDLYASIKLVDRASASEEYSNLYELCPILSNTEGKNLDKLDGQVAKFIGLSLVQEISEIPDDATYTLQLFENGRLCVENKAKLTTNDIYDETRNKLISDEFDTNLLHSQFVEANEIITDEINDINLNYSNNNITLSGNNRVVNMPLANTSSTVSYINQPQTITADKTINSEFVFHKNGQSDINISGYGIKAETNDTSLATNQIIDILYMWGTQYGQNLQILNDGTIWVYSSDLTTTIKPGEIDVDYLNTYDLEVTRYLNNIKFTNTTSDAINLNAVISGDICVLNQPQAFTQPKTRTNSGYISTLFPNESGVALSITNNDKTTKYGFNRVTFDDGGTISSNGSNTLTIKNKNLNGTSITISDGEVTIGGDVNVTGDTTMHNVDATNVEVLNISSRLDSLSNSTNKISFKAGLESNVKLESMKDNANGVSLALDGVSQEIRCKKINSDTTIARDFDLFTELDKVDTRTTGNKDSNITIPGLYAISIPSSLSYGDTFLFSVPDISKDWEQWFPNWFSGDGHFEVVSFYVVRYESYNNKIRIFYNGTSGSYQLFNWRLLLKYPTT